MKIKSSKVIFFASALLIVFTAGCGIKLFNKNKERKVNIETKYGKIVIKLYNETPQHRDNFIKLVKEGFFNDLLFHRVMQNFMIQGGDPDSRGAAAGKRLGMGGPGYTVPAEFDSSLIHKKGALAAARQPDQVNPKKESSGSQFYIVQGRKFSENELKGITAQTGMKYTPEQIEVYENIGGYPPLDMQYTVFGEVVEGLDIVDSIAAVKVDPYNRPVEDVKFTITLD